MSFFTFLTLSSWISNARDGKVPAWNICRLCCVKLDSFGCEVGPENWKLSEAFVEDVEREDNNAQRVKTNTDGLVDYEYTILGDDVLSGVKNEDKKTLKKIENGNECVDDRDLIKGQKIAAVPSPNTSMGSIR